MYKNAAFFKNGKRTPKDGYKDDFIGDNGIEFIEANKDKPFCRYLGFAVPTHRTYEAENCKAGIRRSAVDALGWRCPDCEVSGI